jgi:hypothetical protein
MAADMYTHALELMASFARSLDTTAGTGLDVHVELDRVPAMLQFALDSHAVERSHVQYQSMERWLLGAFGLAEAEPDGHFDNLLEYGVAQHALFGSACCHLAHGPGFTGNHSCNTPADYLGLHNSGSFSERTIHKALPASSRPGTQLHCLLNLFEDVRLHSGAVTYAPEEGCLNTLVNLGFDGMSLGKGTMVDERRLEVAGFDEPIGVEEAKRVLAMDDEQLQGWLAGQPFLSDAVEFIVTAADNSVSGNLGFLFVSSEGTHADVARRLASMLRPLRVCYTCLRCESVLALPTPVCGAVV